MHGSHKNRFSIHHNRRVIIKPGDAQTVFFTKHLYFFALRIQTHKPVVRSKPDISTSILHSLENNIVRQSLFKRIDFESLILKTTDTSPVRAKPDASLAIFQNAADRIRTDRTGLTIRKILLRLL